MNLIIITVILIVIIFFYFSRKEYLPESTCKPICKYQATYDTNNCNKSNPKCKKNWDKQYEECMLQCLTDNAVILINY
jgi:hypothetical protein